MNKEEDRKGRDMAKRYRLGAGRTVGDRQGASPVKANVWAWVALGSGDAKNQSGGIRGRASLGWFTLEPC